MNGTELAPAPTTTPASTGAERRRHRALYRAIPSMRCPSDCSRCCGPAPLSPWEATRLGIPGAVVTPTHPGTATCVFLAHGRCTVYARRPFSCRLYGTTAVAPCERGVRLAPAVEISVVRAVELVKRFEQGCPPDWHERRRVAARKVIAAHGTPAALASLDAAQGAVRAWREYTERRDEEG